MNNWTRKYFLALALFGSFNMLMAAAPAQELRSADLETVQARNFAPGRLEEHYAKHGASLGDITIEQYLHGARVLLDAEPGGDVLEKIRFNGDIEHFRISTGEFAVMTKRGRIRTYFKTTYEYWINH